MKINEVIKYGNLKQGEHLSLSPEKVNDIIDFIKRRCKKIINVYKSSGALLYRGTHTQNDAEFFIAKPFTKRKPKDTAKTYQIAIDNKLSQAGFTALRSNSIFCTSREKTTIIYGTTYVIFPIDGFTYTFAERVDDLTQNYGLSDSSVVMNNLLKLPPQQFCKKLGFKNNIDLESALVNGDEVYIHGPVMAVLSNSLLFTIIMYAIFGDEKAIEMIVTKLSTTPSFLNYIKNPTEEMINTALRKNGLLLGIVVNPTREQELLACQSNGAAIRMVAPEHINEKLKIVAVTSNSGALRHIKNPSKKLLYYAVKHDAWAITKINNPSEDLIIMAVKEQPHVIESLIDSGIELSEAVILEAVKRNGFLIKNFRLGASHAVKLAAVKQAGTAIGYITNPEEDIQLAAINQDREAIFDIKNPTEKAIELANFYRDK